MCHVLNKIISSRFCFFFFRSASCLYTALFESAPICSCLRVKIAMEQTSRGPLPKKNLHYQRAGRLISLSVWPAAVYVSIKVTQYGSVFSWWGFGLLKTLLLLAEVQHARKSFVCVNVWLPSKQMDFKLMQFASNVLFCFVSFDPQCLGISAHDGFLQAQSLLVPK